MEEPSSQGTFNHALISSSCVAHMRPMNSKLLPLCWNFLTLEGVIIVPRNTVARFSCCSVSIFLDGKCKIFSDLKGIFLPFLSFFPIVRWPKPSGWQLEETEMKLKVSPQMKKTEFFCSCKRQSNPQRVIFSRNERLLRKAPFSFSCSLWLKDSPHHCSNAFHNTSWLECFCLTVRLFSLREFWKATHAVRGNNN